MNDEKKIWRLTEMLRKQAENLIGDMANAKDTATLEKYWACFITLTGTCERMEQAFEDVARMPFGIRIISKDVEAQAYATYDIKSDELQEK